MQREDLLADLSEARLPQGKVRSDGKETDRWMEAKMGFEHTKVFLCLIPYADLQSSRAFCEQPGTEGVHAAGKSQCNIPLPSSQAAFPLWLGPFMSTEKSLETHRTLMSPVSWHCLPLARA